MISIHFKRHVKVDFKWNSLYNAKGFNSACIKYDTTHIIPQSIPKNKHKFNNIYISTLLRTEQTANIFGINTLNVQKTKILNEVPIKAFVKTSLKLPTSIWLFMGRVQWFFNKNTQPETRIETVHRIEKLMDTIENESGNILIIGHGFYFLQFKKVLKQKGFVLSKQKTRLKNGETIVFIKH